MLSAKHVVVFTTLRSRHLALGFFGVSEAMQTFATIRHVAKTDSKPAKLIYALHLDKKGKVLVNIVDDHADRETASLRNDPFPILASLVG